MTDDIKNVDALQKAINVLEDYKDTDGHKAIVEVAYQNMNSYLMVYMQGGDDIDLQQNRADFRAWSQVVTSLDRSISSYKNELQMIVDGTERAMQQQMLNQQQMYKGAR